MSAADAFLHQIVANAVVTAVSSTNARKYQRSRCGEDFDEYVFRGVPSPFPFSPVGAASRKLPELWKNRRFKLHYHGKWRQGKVISWEQYNPTPTTLETCWTVQVQLDTVEEGDEVELKLVGEVCSDSSTNDDSGTAKVTSNTGGESKNVCIKVKNDAQVVPIMKLFVHRLNVEGGGTVKLQVSNDEDVTLHSLEWLEPATPSVNLNRDVLTFDCPCCRANESVLAAFDDLPTTCKADCPVCLEAKECRVLTCGHTVCHACWSKCRQVALQVSLELDDLDEEEVNKERANRNRLFCRKRNRDGPRNDFVDTFTRLSNNATDRQGLSKLQWELMVEPPAVWAVGSVLRNFEDLSKEVHQVILQVVEARKQDMPFKEGDEVVDNSGDFSNLCAFFIAKQLISKERNFRAAVPFAELSLYHSLHSQTEMVESIEAAYTFTSQTYALADLFSKALEHLDAAAGFAKQKGETNFLPEARNEILSAMKHWTGTSGELTPGI